MAELWELTALIRSKNAGPFEMTIDVIAKDQRAFAQILDAPSFGAETIARLYRLSPDQVNIVVLEPINAVKIALPRPTPSGDTGDTDVFAGQFHSPLVRLVV
jgi:hypothetical protein